MKQDHLWLPYTQMHTADASLKAVRTLGSRIVLEDGRELIDGIASWWTACHGYNHPHIRSAIERQLEEMPHVMLGGLVHATTEYGLESVPWRVAMDCTVVALFFPDQMDESTPRNESIRFSRRTRKALSLQYMELGLEGNVICRRRSG